MFNHKSLDFKPLTFRQAWDIAKQYQGLIGQNFSGEQAGKIACVAVSPYDEINKWIFTWYYSESKCPKQALAYYAGHFYDVILLAETETEEKVVYRNLKDYLLEHPTPGRNFLKEQL